MNIIKEQIFRSGISPFQRRGGFSFTSLLRLSFILILLSVLPVSCGEIENEFSSRRVYLRFDNATHLDATLMSAMNPMTSNIFCRIWLSGVGKLSFQNNQGSTTTVTLTAREQQYSMVLGISNASGLIVGYGFGGVFYCYDALCPNCYNNSKIEHLLSMNTTGIATCSHCNRQYDMTNNGLSPQGGKLERYGASTTGQTGTLIVNNRYY